MLTRKIQKISSNSLQHGFIFQVDPHQHFVILYLYKSNVMYLFKTIDLTLKASKVMKVFSYKQQYQNNLNVYPEHQIGSNLLFNHQSVNMIAVGKKFNGEQIVAVSNMFRIKTFNIVKNKADRFLFETCREIPFKLQEPIISFNIHLNAIYVTFFDKVFEIYEKCTNGLWEQSQTLNSLDKEFMRLTVYSIPERQQCSYQIKKMQPRYKLQKYQQILNKVEQSGIYLNVEQLATINDLSMKLKIKHLNNQPSQPSILYQTYTNNLFLASYNKKTQDFEHIQLCSMLKDEKVTQIVDNSFETEIYFEGNIFDQIPFIMSQCQNYCIYQKQDEQWSVRSKNLKWSEIITMKNQPFINPFYHQLQNQVIKNFTTLFGQEDEDILSKQIKRLRDQLQFILAASLVPNQQAQSSSWQYFLEIQLIVVQKNSGKRVLESTKKIQNGDNYLDSSEQQVDEKKQDDIDASRQQEKQEHILDSKSATKQELKTSQKYFKNESYKVKVFPLITYDNIKWPIIQLKWINSNELLFSTTQNQLHHLMIEMNLIVSALQDIYWGLFLKKFMQNSDEETRMQISNIKKEVEMKRKSNQRMIQIYQ